jgi:hypothetical protein
MVLVPGLSHQAAAALAARLVRECAAFQIPYGHPLNTRRALTMSAVVFQANDRLGGEILQACDALRTRLYQEKRATGADHAVVADATA